MGHRKYARKAPLGPDDIPPMGQLPNLKRMRIATDLYGKSSAAAHKQTQARLTVRGKVHKTKKRVAKHDEKIATLEKSHASYLKDYERMDGIVNSPEMRRWGMTSGDPIQTHGNYNVVLKTWTRSDAEQRRRSMMMGKLNTAKSLALEREARASVVSEHMRSGGPYRKFMGAL